MTENTDKLFVKLIAPNLPIETVPRILDGLEANPVLDATHASGDERKRVPYVRATAEEAARNGFVSLWRTKAPKYGGWLSTKSSTTDGLTLEFNPAPSPPALAAVFDGAARLADVMRPEFGFVHLCYVRDPDAVAYNRGFASMTGRVLDRVGIANVHARNWFGPYLVKLLGRDFLLAFPYAREKSWGGIQVDLVAEPWSSDFETLRVGQEEVMKRLNATGTVCATEGPPVLWKPGPNWISPGWSPAKRR